MTKFAWSLDGEYWKSGTFDTVALAVDDAIQETDDDVEYVHIGEVRSYSNRDMLPSIDVVVDDIRNRAYDLAGEHAEDYMDVSEEQLSDLENKVNDAIIRWCALNNIAPTFYTVNKSNEGKIR
ncbi:MAG: hypothetical protein ACRC8W_21670 [Plesiomonas shigelloides]